MKKQIYNIIAHTGIWSMQRIFPEYFATEPLEPTDRYIEYPFVLSGLLPPPLKILDVGCSGSMFPLLLKALKYEITGIDVRQYYYKDKIDFLLGDIRETPFPDNSFHIITAVSSIEHIGLKGWYGQRREVNGDVKAGREIYRILKPRGLFLMTVPYGKLKEEGNHRIYDQPRLNLLLRNFTYSYELTPSPEADYQLALIKAMK